MMNRKVMFWPFLRSFGSDQSSSLTRSLTLDPMINGLFGFIFLSVSSA